MLGQPLEDSLDNAAVHRRSHLRLHRQRQKLGRLNQGAVRFDQSDQNFKGDLAPWRVRINDWLGMNFEAVGAYRLANVFNLVLVGAAGVNNGLRQRLDEQLRIANTGGDGLRIGE